MEEFGQPRYIWDVEHAVIASASSNLAILTIYKDKGMIARIVQSNEKNIINLKNENKSNNRS